MTLRAVVSKLAKDSALAARREWWLDVEIFCSRAMLYLRHKPSGVYWSYVPTVDDIVSADWEIRP